MTSDPALAALSAQFAQLQGLFERRLLEDRTKNDLIASVQRSLAEHDARVSGEAYGALFAEALLAIDRLGAHEPSVALNESVIEELLEVFARRGLKAIEAEDRFDPSLHEAVESVPASDAIEAGQITEVQRAGYMLGDRMLRPTRVVIAVSTPADGTSVKEM